jgi:hypothetical protein
MCMAINEKPQKNSYSKSYELLTYYVPLFCHFFLRQKKNRFLGNKLSQFTIIGILLELQGFTFSGRLTEK